MKANGICFRWSMWRNENELIMTFFRNRIFLFMGTILERMYVSWYGLASELWAEDI